MTTPDPTVGKMPTDLQRITTIGDSVFAVALTLIAVGIRLPPELIGKSLTAADLVPLLNDMGAVILSFCVASVIWLGHWMHLRKAIRTTVPFLIANLTVLLCIILLPISTRLLSAGPLSTASAAVYGVNLLATSLSEFIFRRLANVLALPEGESLPPTKLPRELGSMYALTIHTSALVAAFFNPHVSVTLWLLAFGTPLIERWVHRVNVVPPERSNAA